MTIRHVSTDDPNFPRWIRSAALAINSLIGALETFTPGSIYFAPQAAPTAPIEGQAYYDATLHKLRVWDGSTWQNCW